MKTRKQRGGKRRGRLAIVVLVLAAYVAWTLLRPLSQLSPTPALAQTTLATASKLVWPAQGQSAVGVADSSILDTYNAQTPVPTASTAKLVTALTVLKKKPLQPGEQGPTITLTASDVALYTNYLAQDGSLVQVQAGEQISEYQMLETMMLPSANNMADSLAIWAFGSLAAYASAANQYVQSLGLSETHIGSDASGLSPTTTSTAHDMVRIGEVVMQNTVLSQIVSQPTASGIPVVGSIRNVNSLLGTNGIVGIKTGNSDQAGGAFVSASHAIVNGKQVTIITAVMASPTLAQAMKDSLPLIQSAQANFSTVTAVPAGVVVGKYALPWGGSVKARPTAQLSTTIWNGSTPNPKVSLAKISAKTSAGSQVGTVSIAVSPFSDQASTPVELHDAPTRPSISWRLTHPL